MNNNRNTGIDVLRGISILAVILLHLNIHFGLKDTFLKEVLPKRLFTMLFWSGYYGVVIFFTISGYLIANSILNRWQTLDKIRLKKFYCFRFSRIMPMLTALLLVLSVLHLAGAESYVINKDQTSLAYAIFAALTFHFNWLEMNAGYLPANWDVLWTISIEETFYLVFPLLCLLFRKNWLPVVLFSAILLLSPWFRTHLFLDNELGDRNNFAYIDTISVGCFIAVISHKYRFSPAIARTLLASGWLLALFIFVFRDIVFQLGITGLGLDLSILAAGTGMLLLGMHNIHRDGLAKDRLAFRWLSRMGNYSYEIYLTHMFVVIAAAGIYRHLNISEAYIPLFICLSAAICYVLGNLVFRYFSEPVNLKLKKHRAKVAITQATAHRHHPAG